MPPRFTTIVAIDKTHLEELRLSWPTWERNAPECIRYMLVIHDDMSANESIFPSQLDPDAPDGIGFMTNSRLVQSGAVVSASSLLPAGFPRDPNATTQRERMLTALAMAPKLVQMSYYLKLDTDTIATKSGRSVADSWFAYQDKPPAIIAPRWGYTKPGHWLDSLDRWADEVAPGNEKPKRESSGGVAKSPRIISYAMFGRTDFAKSMIELIEKRGRLPVPSQDTFSWYAASLFREPIVRLNPSASCWRHYGGNLNRLKLAAAEAVT